MNALNTAIQHKAADGIVEPLDQLSAVVDRWHITARGLMDYAVESTLALA